MAYNKTKYVEAAQKYLHQGKIPQAIGEYQNILKREPKDQVTLMTVGDLFVRQGETFQALEYFERLAQIFLAEGFVGKAIAIYKKIAKLAPEETRPVERLAELYVQQGVLSEARPIYLQLAELHQRAGRHQQAIGLLQKLLEAEPDNLRVHVRLAELSLAEGAPAQAVASFRAAAELLQRRGDYAEAMKYADRALKTDPDDLPTLAFKARLLAGNSHRSDAIALLQSLPDLEQGGETADLLIDLYLEAGELERAADFASRILARNSKHFVPALRVAEAQLEAAEPHRALPLLELVRQEATDAGQHEHVSQILLRAAERMPDRVEPREWLVDLYGRVSDSFRLPDALANLASAYEAAGQHERAQQIFAQLLERNPDHELAQSKVSQTKEPQSANGAPAAQGIPEPQETEASPQPKEPQPDSTLDEETQRFIMQALTDVDLFASYGLSQKAMDLLETVLERAPRHAAALERLLDLYLGAGDERRTAELAAQLERVHSDNGDRNAAERFRELRQRFERAAGIVSSGSSLSPNDPLGKEPTPVVPAAPSESELQTVQASASPLAEEAPAETSQSSPVPEPEGETLEDEASVEPVFHEGVHEVDLSEEWAALSSQWGQAEQASPEPALTPEVATTDAEPAASVSAEPAPAPVDKDIEKETEEEFLIEPSPEYELEFEPFGGTPAAEALSADDFLSTLATDFASALPKISPEHPEMPFQVQPTIEPAAAPAESAPEPTPVAEEPVGPLSDLFEEFRAGLDDLSTNGEDLETHYNLGIAYREMGLIDEAISEFQKVAKANRKGAAFPYAMQCCTLLGLAFMEKGEPAIAAMWYQRALEIPGLDQESVLALRYDLGVAQELAGDTSAARRSFSQVYGMNIDYRDVADRLAALGKGI